MELIEIDHTKNLASLIKTLDKANKMLVAQVRRYKGIVVEQAELIAWLKNKHEGFYLSPQWLDLRTRVLETFGSVCMCCGARPDSDAVIQVDHIKPMSTHPELALEFDNLQVLCMPCNLGKSNKTQKDYRPKK